MFSSPGRFVVLPGVVLVNTLANLMLSQVCQVTLQKTILPKTSKDYRHTSFFDESPMLRHLGSET